MYDLRQSGPLPVRRRGFTLIEVLVVVGLIVLLAGALGLALRGGEGGSGLIAAERAVAGLFQGARAQAVLLGTEARVIIADDVSDPDRYMRTLALVYLSTDPAKPGVWLSNGEAVTLPPGLYVIPANYSGTAPVRSSADGQGMGFVEGFPFRESTASGGSAWLSFAYDAQGVARQPGAKIVIGAGRRLDVDTPVVFNAEQVAGFALARFGGLIPARSPQDLQ